MFVKSSRYHGQKTVEATTPGGRVVTALTVRRLSPVKGSPRVVTGMDRLDLMAQELYDDPSRFWHIADANTVLDATTLTGEPGATIYVPEE